MNDSQKKLAVEYVSDRLTGGTLAWGDLCRKAGVSLYTAKSFQMQAAHKAALDYFVGLGMDKMKASVLPVVEALIKKAKSGETNAIKVFFTSLGMMGETQGTDGPPPVVLIPGWAVDRGDGANAKTFNVTPEESK